MHALRHPTAPKRFVIASRWPRSTLSAYGPRGWCASQVDPIGGPIRYETERDPVATRVVICDRLTHEVAEAASGN